MFEIELRKVLSNYNYKDGTDLSRRMFLKDTRGKLSLHEYKLWIRLSEKNIVERSRLLSGES